MEANHWEIMISYSRGDLRIVEQIHEALTNSKMTVWRDQQDISGGALWSDNIATAIKSCDMILLFVSASSIKSQYVNDELTLAKKCGRKIMPVRLEDIDPSGGFELKIINYNYVDVFNLDIVEKINRVVFETNKFLGRKEIDISSRGSLGAMQGQLVTELNSKHSALFEKTGAIFQSLWQTDENNSIYFPIVFGVQRNKLVFEFLDCRIKFYFEFESWTDELKKMLIAFSKNRFSHVLPDIEKGIVPGKGQVKQPYLTFIDHITVPVLKRTIENQYEEYRDYVISFLSNVFDPLAEWIITGRTLQKLYSEIEKRLKDVYSETDGWVVDNNISKLQKQSNLTVYNKKWVKKCTESWKGEKPILCYYLRAELMGEDHNYGIWKTDVHLALGSYAELISNKCDEIFETIGSRSFDQDNKTWFHMAYEQWRNANIVNGNFAWNTEESQQDFISYFVDLFSKMKILTPIIDELSLKIDEIQPPYCELPEHLTWDDKPVIARLRALSQSDIFGAIKGQHEIIWGFNQTWHVGFKIPFGNENSYVFTFNVEPSKYSFCLEWRDGPSWQKDFIFNKYFAKKKLEWFPNAKWIGGNNIKYCVLYEKITEEQPLAGASLEQWLNRFELELKDVMPAVMSLVLDLQAHYNKIMSLISDVCSALSNIFPQNEGWKIHNETQSLSQYAGINVWHSSWLKKDSDAKPDIYFYIVGEKHCFDDMHFGIVKNSKEIIIPETQKTILTSLCKYAFGEIITDDWHIFYKCFTEDMRYTGGWDTERAFLDIQNKDAFIKNVCDNFIKLKDMAPFMREANEELQKSVATMK